MKNIDWTKIALYLALIVMTYIWWAGAYHLAFCQVITNQLQVYSPPPPPPPAPIYVAPAPVYGGTYVENNTTVIINNQNVQQGR